MNKELFIRKYGGKSRYEKFAMGKDIESLFGVMKVEKEHQILNGVLQDLKRSFQGRPYVITYDKEGKFIESVFFGGKDD